MSQAPVHVVIVCPGLGKPGAVANVALNHGRELSQRFRITMISEAFPKSADIAAVNRINSRSFDFHFLRRLSHVPREVSFALSVKRAVKRLHKSVHVDFVIAHGHPVAAIALAPLSRKYGIPYGLVTHGDIFDRPQGTYDSRLTWLYEQTTPYAYRNAALVVALSPYMAKRSVSGGASRDKVVVIPNGVDPGEIGLTNDRPALRTAGRDKFSILYVGRLSIEKGVDTLLEAVSVLVQRRIGIRLKIIGVGKEEYRLRKFVDTQGLGSDVEFVGEVKRSQLGQYYRAADVVCVPSRSDSLPTVVLEAMTSGIPVVGSDTGGIPFLIKNEVTGLIFPVGGVTQLTAHLEGLATDRRRVERLGKAAHAEAKESYSWPAVSGRLATEIEFRLNLPD